MVTLAVTGHMDLTEESVPLVRAALRDLIAGFGPEVTGVSCIAAGSDTIFAEEVTAAGGQLIVVIPSQNYREAKVKPDHAPSFDRLITAASEVVTLPHPTANRAAYEEANDLLLRRAHRLVAVWDGSPPAGRGGTADTVALAREAGMPVDVVWPATAARRG
ncbi:hypothetical protein ABT354_21890 [Streptomyces sp. NPDC000594]|uniref:hypothetical protein n=1 Tax=Streptomyces sp. NPDC000594 TaxID=3154261 RepID=UPI0033206F88